MPQNLPAGAFLKLDLMTNCTMLKIFCIKKRS